MESYGTTVRTDARGSAVRSCAMDASTAVNAPPEGVDYDRKWLVLIAVGMAIFLGTIDGSIVNVALPTLAEEFSTTFGVVQWVSLGYLLTQATLTLGFGRLGDMVGKKPIFTAGFAVFTLFSVLAGLAPSIELLIAARVLQAVGAAMVFALGFAITTEAFPASERGKALGISGATVSLGIIVGPVLGGLLIDVASWRLIFLVNLPIGIIGTITASRFVPHTRPAGRHRFDWPGAVLFFLAFLSFLGSLTFGQDAGFGDPVVLVGFVLAACLFGLFIAVELHSPEPMLDLGVFRNRNFSVNLVTGFMQFVCISGLLLILPFYLEKVLGYEPRNVGLLLAAIPIALGISAPISGTLSDRLGTRPVTVAGLLVTASGFLLAAFLFGLDTEAWQFILPGAIIGTGVGIFQSPNNSAILGEVPPHRLGITSGMLTINRISGSIVGIAVLGTVWATRTTAYAGGGTAESAAPEFQAAGLSDTLVVATVLTVVALGIGTWAWIRDRKDHRTTVRSVT